jgi:cysteine desulfurase
MDPRIYLDWNATTPLCPEARAAMAETWDAVGNPSSVHAEGRAARRVVEESRAVIADALGTLPRRVVFTSGGTEANALALTPGIPGARGAPLDRLIVSAIEHPSVLAGGRFAPMMVARAPVTSDGRIDLDALDKLLTGASPALVSVMAANNETGVIQPVSEVAALVRAAGGRLHVDAVQAFGKIAVARAVPDADLVTVSAHKLGGPKGVGALVVWEDAVLPTPLIRGGGQERGHRAGTEDVAGIAGFAAAVRAAEAARQAEAARLAALRAQLEAGLATVAGTVILARESLRLPNTVLAALPGHKAETAVIAFDLAGIAVSSGSACSSGKVQPSHVLAAMGVPEQLARAAIRISLGRTTTEAEITRFLSVWRDIATGSQKKVSTEYR